MIQDIRTIGFKFETALGPIEVHNNYYKSTEMSSCRPSDKHLSNQRETDLLARVASRVTSHEIPALQNLTGDGQQVGHAGRPRPLGPEFILSGQLAARSANCTLSHDREAVCIKECSGTRRVKCSGRVAPDQTRAVDVCGRSHNRQVLHAIFPSVM